MGRLKSLVNKFLAVNRLHGLVIVPILTLDPVFGSMVPLDNKNFYCRSIEVILFYLSLNFWANNIVIALVRSANPYPTFILVSWPSKFHPIISQMCFYRRYIFFKFPIEMHNQFPSQKEKATLFYQLLRSEWDQCSMPLTEASISKQF